MAKTRNPSDLTTRNAKYYEKELTKLRARCGRLEFRLTKLDADYRLRRLERKVKP